MQAGRKASTHRRSTNAPSLLERRLGANLADFASTILATYDVPGAVLPHIRTDDLHVATASDQCHTHHGGQPTRYPPHKGTPTQRLSRATRVFVLPWRVSSHTWNTPWLFCRSPRASSVKRGKIGYNTAPYFTAQKARRVRGPTKHLVAGFPWTQPWWQCALDVVELVLWLHLVGGRTQKKFRVATPCLGGVPAVP